MTPNLTSLRRLPLAATALLAAILVIAATAFEIKPINVATAQEKRECPVRVTLLQVNDVYQFAPVDGGKRGGLARVSTLRKKIMKESPHTLFLMAGDTISPSIESTVYKYKGAQMIEAWNTSGLDYAAFGNHEFDFGDEVLKARVGESRFKWLAANVIDKKTGKLFADTPEFVVREFEGVKVGLFGILLPATLRTSSPNNVDILDPCATALRVMPKIRAAGAQVIVALTHLSMAEDKQLARCSGVDVIIGGHEHTLLESMSGHAPIFKMTSDARELGRIDLNISKSTGKLESIDWQVIQVTEDVESDPAFASLDQKYGPLLKTLEETAGTTDVDLNAKSADGRTQETNVGDFIADAYRQATGADVGLVNGGSIRADAIFKRGVLTKRDVISILPYNNKVVKLQIPGAVLRAALEHGVASIGTEAEPGRFPQVSGLRFVYDATRKPGARITSITINGKALDDKQNYTLATTVYVVGGGDGYNMFANPAFLIRSEQTLSEMDILQKAITAQQPIKPQTDGRIKRTDVGKEQSSCN
jgi:5'-nucleotidase / UDP-sugar diphosphatase